MAPNPEPPPCWLCKAERAMAIEDVTEAVMESFNEFMIESIVLEGTDQDHEVDGTFGGCAWKFLKEFVDWAWNPDVVVANMEAVDNPMFANCWEATRRSMAVLRACSLSSF